MDGKNLLNVSIDAILHNRTDVIQSVVQTCKEGNFDTYEDPKVLLDVILNSLSNNWGTLLHFATQLDKADIVKTLLLSGCDPCVKNTDGKTGYDLQHTEKMATVYAEELLRCAACPNDASDSISKLISSGVPVDSQDFASTANSALHWAASFGNPDNVQCLLDYGANVNICNSDGTTPLHDAVLRKHKTIIKQLLIGGADPLIKSLRGKHQGKTPIDLAHDELKEIFMDQSNSTEDFKLNNLNKSASNSNDSLSKNHNLVEDIKQLSITPSESPVKHDIATFITRTSSLPPFPPVSAPPPLVTDTKLHLLWPLPQQITQIEAPSFNLNCRYSVSVIYDVEPAEVAEIKELWKFHIENMMIHNIECFIEEMIPLSIKPTGKIICHVSSRLLNKKQSYRININSEQIKILGSDVVGLHYGLCTLNQLFSLYKDEDSFPSLFLEDSPILASRAVLLDLSPGARKPTMETIKGFIKIFSSLKLNEIHFYFRLGLKNGNKWPYSNCDLVELTSICQKYFLMPVLAFDVSPDATFEDLDEYLSHIQPFMYLFSSRKIHLGPNLSILLLEDVLKHDCDFKLFEKVNLPSDCLVYMCSNGYSSNKRIMNSLPYNVLFVEFGYLGTHDYDSCVKSIVTSGFTAFIGVGTSSWGSISGCPESAINNIFLAAQSAARSGALGFIIADWKTTPHHPAFCFSWPGIVLAAGLSWNYSVHLDFLHSRLPELLNHHVLNDSQQLAGYLTFELGRLEAFVHQAMQNTKGVSLNPLTSSVLHQFLIDPDCVPLDNLTTDLLQQTIQHLKKFKDDLHKAQPLCFQRMEFIDELNVAVHLMLFSCRLAKVMVTNGSKPSLESCGLAVVNIGISNLLPTIKTDLANRLLPLIELFRDTWLYRNLPCGLHESLYRFNVLLHKLIPDSEHYFASADGFVRHSESISESKKEISKNS